MFRFHSMCGTRIKFSNDNRTAERLSAKTDFNNGVVFSDKKLETNVIFQVRVDKRVGLWSGSIELGVTTINPDSFTIETVPQSATELLCSTWLMASRTILQDGETLIENYGFDLEKLEEGDTVGLMRTNQGELVFFVNGTSQGVASQFVPPDIYVVVNLYGKCGQVSLEDVEASEQSTNTVEHVVHEEVCNSYSSSENNSENDKLRFHSNCGPLVKLSSHNRTAERRRPMEEFNNAVVLTHRPLRDDELFQIRIDLLVHKWSGSIEFGLTTHNPATFDFPATMTIMRNGTVIMSGNGILHDGKATNSPYTNFNLDQLKEGDRIGVMKKGSGDIHYFVNGVDQGVATAGICHQVWGAINLYGMAAKVTIVDRNEREEHNLRINVRTHHEYIPSVPVESDDCLLFHSNCGFHAAVINSGRTAHRPNARDDFNHGVVLTNRILKPNELFEVRLDKMVTKWAGSIEIGVTTHVPTQLDYPCTMTNVRSGTWMMTGNGIMHNGTSIVDEYGQSLDRLKVGDRVGVLRKENGNLHFFVNGEDQGCAATNVPESVFGVIDLYGQAAQATIIIHNNNSSGTMNYVGSSGNNADDNVGVYCNSPFYGQNNMNMVMSGSDTIFSGDLKFHTLHGRNARVSNNGLTASRPNALGEFNAAIVVSSRALRDNELFEVVIERMVDRWSGNIEAGVTTIRPEELVFPNTMTDIDHDTWMLSGSSIMTGGCTVTNRYNCNLDALTVGSRVGMMRRSDGTLHYFVNGEDVGIAAYDIPQNIYAVIDLYGQCAQVSITKLGDMSMISSQVVDSLSLPLANDTSHRFSVCCGKNVMLKNNNLTANRVRHYTHGLVFSSTPLEFDETFEVRLTEVRNKWAGCLTIGLTNLTITDDYPASHIPPIIGAICAETWYISGSAVRKNNIVLKENYCTNLNRLSVGDRVGIRICSDKSLKLYINGEDMGPAAFNLPKKMYVVVDLYGSAEAVTITSTVKSVLSPNEAVAASTGMESSHSLADDCSLHKDKEGTPQAQPGPSSLLTTSTTSISTFTFDGKHGRNIELSNGNMTARRTSSYNQGVVITSQILQRGQMFQILYKLNPKWTSSLMIGVIECPPDRITFPLTALQFKKSCWVIATDSVYQNGLKIKSKYGPNLDSLQDSHTIGIMINSQGNLHLFINGVDQGVAAKNVSTRCRALVDLYGQCEEVTITNGSEGTKDPEQEPKLEKWEKTTEKALKPVEGNLIKNCEYLNLCIRFKTTLCLPEPYFVLSEPVMCYCETCHKIRGDQPVYKHGDPPADYTIPLGWVRFPVNINFDTNACSNYSATGAVMTNSTSSLSNVLTTWHVAYHGLKISHVRRVMDFGQLYTDFGFGCEHFPKKTKGKDEKTDEAPLIFSPSIEYASIPQFSPPKIGYSDGKTKRKLSARVAFQLLVQPGSYKRGPPSFPSPLSCPVASCSTSSSTSTTDLDLESLEWSTKEQGSTHVSALLVRVDGFTTTV